MAGEFIGRGWAFPLRTTATGGIALVEGDEEIAEAIRLVLGTAPGERPMRPDFGCRIHDLVFDPNDASLVGLVEAAVRESLVRWEPRIDLLAVEVAPDPVEHGVLLITVRYAVSDDNDERNLVFPFYAIPEE